MKAHAKKAERISKTDEVFPTPSHTILTDLSLNSFEQDNRFGSSVLHFAIKPTPNADENQLISAATVIAMPMAQRSDLESPNEGWVSDNPTHKIYDAKFREFINILEEFDGEVQEALQGLRTHCAQLSVATDQIRNSTLLAREDNLGEFRRLQEAIHQSANLQQEILSDMFMAIDSKIGEITAHLSAQTHELVKKVDSDRREAVANLQQEMKAMETRSLCCIKDLSDTLESRMSKYEQKSSNDIDSLRKIFADGLSRLSPREV
ncbi:MAG TPA: hypothetical protein VM144_04415 [Aestuariivirga sp.]|nr:hypothetical protein [Aestuariivirga sp.]